MITNLDKAVAAIGILQDDPRPPIQRYEAAMNSLDSLELSSLGEDARQRVDFELVRCNQILAKYSIKETDSFAEVIDADAVQLVSHILDMAKVVRDSAIETVMARLRHHQRKLPVPEIETARRHRSLFIPILLQELQDDAHRLGNEPQDAETHGDHSSVPFFAFLLMFEWNVTAAVPLILQTLRLPGEAPFELYGDIVHEYASRFLAHFLAEDPDRIEALIRDPDANLYVRWAACGAYRYLVRDEKMTNADAIKSLTTFAYDCRVIGDDARPGMGHPYELIAGILDTIGMLGGGSEEIIPNTDEIWKFVDETVIDREYFYGQNQAEEPPKYPTDMPDCLGELQHWAAFDHKPEIGQRPPKPKDRPRPSPIQLPQPSLVEPQQQVSSQRIGRNELCPCGSGKKYKKCCLRTSSG